MIFRNKIEKKKEGNSQMSVDFPKLRDKSVHNKKDQLDVIKRL